MNGLFSLSFKLTQINFQEMRHSYNNIVNVSDGFDERQCYISQPYRF